MKRKWIGLMLCAALLAGCAGEAGPSGASAEVPGGGIQRMDIRQELEPVNTENAFEKAAYFGDMVYQCQPNQNTLVSPLSLDMALGLAAEGSAGDTAKELADYLGREDYGTFAKEYLDANEEYRKRFEGFGQNGYQVRLELANSVWVEKTRKLKEEYKKKASERFYAEVQNVDFRGAQVEKTVKQINRWCDTKTHGLIPQIITKDSISPDLSVILINSLYFEAPWTESWSVREGTFTDFAGKETSQEMLYDGGNVYYENDQATAFGKSYMGGMTFVGILPKKTGEFTLSELDLKSLMESRTGAYDVRMMMPKLDFDTTANNIVSILKAQGVSRAFDSGEADFSGLLEMQGDEVTFISDIIQKCKIELDENGTKAAAVTAIMMETCEAVMEPKQVKTVYLDRPFAFLIYDEANQQILFVGKVVSVE